MESGRYLDSFNIISTSDFGGRHLEFLSTVPYPCTVSGMVANVGVALESIRYLSVQHFHFRLGAAILNFDIRTTSGNVCSDILTSGMVENVGITVIDSQSHHLQFKTDFHL